MKARSAAQYERQRHRDARGRYESNPCELCGRGVSFEDYWSWQYCNDHGVGVELHPRCAKKLDAMTENEALRMLEESKR
jgi:hypothetical protein